MPGIKPFLAGMLAGGCLSCAALQYHVVRSDEGVFLVPRNPKLSLTLAYVDTRDWADEQWDRYPQLVDALTANGAADLLTTDAKPASRNELKDTMERSLDDLVPFEADDDVDSDVIVNRPSNRIRDSFDSHDPVTTHGRSRDDGFLDDVRSELDWSFGQSESDRFHSRPNSGSFDDDIRDARQRMDSKNDNWGDNTFSDSLYDLDSSLGTLSGSDDPYSGHSSPDGFRHRSFESGVGAEETDSQKYVPAPKFDDDDDILNRFAPRSGAVHDWDSRVTMDDASWLDDPWAESHSTNKTRDVDDQQTESSPGWTPTPGNRGTHRAVSGLLDRFNSAASDAARESIDRTRRAASGVARDQLKTTGGWAGDSIDEAIKFDGDGLYSPFKEVD